MSDVSLSAWFPPCSLDSQTSMTRPLIDDGPRAIFPGSSQPCSPDTKCRCAGLPTIHQPSPRWMVGLPSSPPREKIADTHGLLVTVYPPHRQPPFLSIPCLDSSPCAAGSRHHPTDGRCGEQHDGPENTQPSPGLFSVLIPSLEGYPWITRLPSRGFTRGGDMPSRSFAHRPGETSHVLGRLGTS
ncbi:hypothetical protein B0T18DRAFT_100910 [Schizothecium vesticola]|uniref:Uncharacterized protein n=1 Tax=Schizothecium vesticola TaxID=314040 RepID=A0AA40F102_9PEZI|nr:hypothetical protein B0T18DRAFT_100910 [Schizothecium vesticola]